MHCPVVTQFVTLRMPLLPPDSDTRSNTGRALTRCIRPVRTLGRTTWACTGRASNGSRRETVFEGADEGCRCARRCGGRRLRCEVTTDRAPAYPRVIEELIPATCHVTEQYANNPAEADHGRLKARLRPMCGLKQLRSARVISAGTRSSGTSDAATTNSAWISTHGI
jgi:hypothetical protein